MAKKDIDTKANERISLFRLLADRNRYRVIEFLMRAKTGESVGELAEVLDMSHSSVSHLLAVLHDAGIVSYKKKGREAYYEIDKTPQAKRIARLLRI